MQGDTSHLEARFIAQQVASLFRDLVRQRLREILVAEVDRVLDEVLKDLPVEVQSAIALDRYDPLGAPHVQIGVKAGRLP